MDKVLTFNEFAQRAGFTRRSLERLIAEGMGPAIVHLTARRRGILEKDAQEWLLSRRHPAPQEVEPRKRGRPRKVAALEGKEAA